MKISHISKKFKIAGTVAILALGISLHASAIPVFTVDPNAAFGAIGGTHPGPFQADDFGGSASALLTLNAGHVEIDGQGWVDFSRFDLRDQQVSPSVSGLNNDWRMWAEFIYSQVLTSGVYGAPGSSYTISVMHVDFWADPSLATDTTFIRATDGGAASVRHGNDSFQIGAADLIAGKGDINSLSGGVFNAELAFKLKPAGADLFTSPTPFYPLSFSGFNNTSIGVSSASDNYITINQATSAFDFNTVPEPATLALVGSGLLGIGAMRRRKT